MAFFESPILAGLFWLAYFGWPISTGLFCQVLFWLVPILIVGALVKIIDEINKTTFSLYYTDVYLSL